MRTALRAGALAALALTIQTLPTAASAGPADYVSSPIVEEGEREIDLKLGSAKFRDGTRETQQSLGLGLGVNSWWFTELYALWHKVPGESHGFDAWEWENKFQLTETGKYPVDVGLLLEIERPKDRSEGYEVRWGPLLQSDLTPNVQANLNLLFEHDWARPDGTRLKLQWQALHRLGPGLRLGLQGFGELGRWNDWARTSVRTGPVLRLGLPARLEWQAAYLWGRTNARRGDMFSTQLSLAF